MLVGYPTLEFAYIEIVALANSERASKGLPALDETSVASGKGMIPDGLVTKNQLIGMFNAWISGLRDSSAPETAQWATEQKERLLAEFFPDAEPAPTPAPTPAATPSASEPSPAPSSQPPAGSSPPRKKLMELNDNQYYGVLAGIGMVSGAVTSAIVVKDKGAAYIFQLIGSALVGASIVAGGGFAYKKIKEK
jgi:hypothetical protein